jgi:hypothetical protein
VIGDAGITRCPVLGHGMLPGQQTHDPLTASLAGRVTSIATNLAAGVLKGFLRTALFRKLRRMTLQEVAGELDLERALKSASRGSSLLPPRPDQGVGGEVARRFHEALRHRLESGGYSPEPGYVVAVPKPGHTTRPAAVLTLDDRTVTTLS